MNDPLADAGISTPGGNGMYSDTISIDRLLVVDDDIKSTKLITAYLKPFVKQAMVAKDGESAYRMALKEDPDIIVMDWSMPIMNGLESTLLLKADERTKDIPIILTTGMMTQSSDLRVALEAGAMDYLQKPFDEIELTARVKSAIKASRTYREVKDKNEQIKRINHDLLKQKNELQGTLRALNSMQQRMIDTEKMASIGILSAGISHEINNPLNFIKHGVMSLERELRNEKVHLTKKTVNIFRAINEGVKRASLIVKSLNNFSKSDNTVKKSCNLHQIIENCLVVLNTKLKERIEVRREFWADPIFITGNEGKLHQALLNVLANAEQAISEKGTISIRTVQDERFIHIFIADSGIGIAAENIHKISDPFFTTKPVGKGTGLGLAITYQIIEQHGGRIFVSSESNKGSTLEFRFNKQV